MAVPQLHASHKFKLLLIVNIANEAVITPAIGVHKEGFSGYLKFSIHRTKNPPYAVNPEGGDLNFFTLPTVSQKHPLQREKTILYFLHHKPGDSAGSGFTRTKSTRHRASGPRNEPELPFTPSGDQTKVRRPPLPSADYTTRTSVVQELRRCFQALKGARNSSRDIRGQMSGTPEPKYSV